MSESDVAQLFTHIERNTRSDPEIQAMIKALELEMVLNVVSGLSDFEVEELMRWAASTLESINATLPYFDEPVIVSGLVSQPAEKADSDSVIWNNKVVKSRGFTVKVLTSSSSSSPTFAVGHAFLIDEFSEQFADMTGLKSYVPRHNGFAHIQDVEVNHAIGSQSPETILGHTIPELKAMVDSMIDSDELNIHTLQGLADLRVALNDDIPSSVKQNLEKYITDKINFDSQIPYRIQVTGLLFDTTSHEGPSQVRSVQGEKKELIVYPFSVRFLPIPEVTDGEITFSVDQYLTVEMAVVAKHKGDPITQLTVPIKNIIQIIPLRQELFRQMEDI